MSVLGDFHNSRVTFRSIVLALIVESSFVYTCLYFIVPNFILKTMFHIPMLFSLCLGFIMILIGNFFVFNAKNSDEDETDVETEINWGITAFSVLIQTCIVGLFCYFLKWKLLYFSITLVVSGIVIGFIIASIIRRVNKKAKPAK